MATEAYDEILKRAEAELTPEEQNRMAESLARRAATKARAATHSITDLKGLGKGIWQGVDADEYVAEERDSWDG